MSTRAELRLRVMRTFIRTDKETLLNECLNDTYKEMLAIIAPRKLHDQVYKNTVAGREEYPLPSAVLRIMHPIRIIDPDTDSSAVNNYPLRFINKDEYDQWEPNPNAGTVNTSRPWAYTIFKNSILLTGIPNKVYTLEMNIGGEVTALDNDADESILSSMWDETHAAGALARAFHRLKQYDAAKSWNGIYTSGYSGEGGLALLKVIERDNNQAVLIVKPNML